MVATRGYAHARIAVLERPKRDATRRDAHRPLLGGYGRARDRGITAGPVASLPSPPSPPRELQFFGGGTPLAYSLATHARQRSPLSRHPAPIRARCVLGVGRARARVAVRPTEGNGARERRGAGGEASRRGNRGKRFPHTTPPPHLSRPLHLGRRTHRRTVYVRGRTRAKAFEAGPRLRRYGRETDHVTGP